MNENPVAHPIQHLSPAEAARRLGVTIKALRLYEARGLVTPTRTSTGWRAYGPDAMARLHQVLALKRLGLPLQRIATALKDDRLGLADVLAVQEKALLGEQTRLARALNLVRRARGRLAAGERLGIDDLATLTQETTVTEKLTDQDWADTFEPLIQKHYTPAELDALKARAPNADEQADVQQQWSDLIAEATAMMEGGVDPKSPEAVNLARRWKALQDRFTGGDPAIADKVKAVWQDAMADPTAAQRLPINPALWGYVARAAEALRAAGEGAA